MRARWLIDRRDILLLALLALVSLALCAVSIGDRIEARRETRKALLVVQRADSLVKDWIGHGCAPLTKSVP